MSFLKCNSFLVISTLFLVLLSKSLFGQTYPIPFAEKQPAWVFPLWFTNGDGQKDTIYLAYDQDASSATEDSLYGEYPIEPGGSEFDVRFGPNWKVFATDVLSYGFVLSLSNIVYPFFISYDSKLLYNDSLPGASSTAIPKVWAWLEGSGDIEDCPNFDFDGYIVILSDVTIDGYPSSDFDEDLCIKDSIVKVDGVATMALALREWNPPTAVSPIDNRYDHSVDLWINGSSLFITNSSSVPSQLRLYNLSGILLQQVELPPGVYTISETLNRMLQESSGVLLVSIVSATGVSTHKLFKP